MLTEKKLSCYSMKGKKTALDFCFIKLNELRKITPWGKQNERDKQRRKTKED